MKLKQLFEQILKEKIRSSVGHRDDTAIQSVVDGSRGLGFITLRGATIDKNEFWDIVKKNKLNILKVPSNPYNALIYFNDGFEKEANELKDIAEKYDGFLAYNATEEDTRRIGELLGYEDDDIEEFISTHYKK